MPPATLDVDSDRFLRYVRSGETSVLDRLIADHLDRVFTHLNRFMGNAAEAEDVVQDTFIELIRTAQRFDGTIPFCAWLGRIAHHAALTRLRARRRRVRHENRARDHHAGTDVSDPADDSDEAELIRAAVRDLPEGFRASVDLHYFAGLSQSDTAKALGVKENTVAVRLHRARECLRDLLQRRGIAIGGAVTVTALVSAPAHAAPATLTSASVLNSIAAAAKRTSGMFAAKAGHLGFAIVASLSGAKAAKIIGIALLLGLVMASAVFLKAVGGRPSRLDQHWTFEHGLPADFVVKQGKADLVAPTPTEPGHLATSDETLVFLLPTRIPPAPIAVSARFTGPRSYFVYGATWTDTFSLPAHHIVWKEDKTSVAVGVHTVIDYFIDNRDYKFIDGTLDHIKEYASPYPFDRICLSVGNLDLEEVTLRTLDEVPTEVLEAKNKVGSGSASLVHVMAESFPSR